MQACTEAARGAGPGQQADRLARVALEHRGVGVQGARERLDLHRRGALLRAEDPGDALLAAQHVVDVAGDVERDVGQARVEARRVNPVQARERAAAAPELGAVGVEQADAESLRHPGAAVVGPGIAAAKQDALRARVERVGDELADAVSRRRRWVAQVPGDERETGGGGHLEHRGDRAVAAEQPEVGRHRVADWAGNEDVTQFAAGGGDQRAREALAAVDQRGADDLRVGDGAPHAGGDVVGDGVGVEALLEAGRGDEHGQGHGSSSVVVVAVVVVGRSRRDGRGGRCRGRPLGRGGAGATEALELALGATSAAQRAVAQASGVVETLSGGARGALECGLRAGRRGARRSPAARGGCAAARRRRRGRGERRRRGVRARRATPRSRRRPHHPSAHRQRRRRPPRRAPRPRRDHRSARRPPPSAPRRRSGLARATP